MLLQALCHNKDICVFTQMSRSQEQRYGRICIAIVMFEWSVVSSTIRIEQSGARGYGRVQTESYVSTLVMLQ